MYEVQFLIDGYLEDSLKCDTLSEATKLAAEWTKEAIDEHVNGGGLKHPNCIRIVYPQVVSETWVPTKP